MINESPLPYMNLEVLSSPALMVLKGKLPPDLYAELCEDSQKIYDTHMWETYDNQLIGNFKNGEQIKIKGSHDSEYAAKQQSYQKLEKIKLEMCRTYLHSYLDIIKNNQVDPARLEMSFCDMWLNVQKEADFNPLHNHTGNSNMALSSFAWLTFPPQVMENIHTKDHAGWTYIHFNHSPSRPIENFALPGSLSLVPEPGAIFVFPSNTWHVVYPFKGEGTRMSLASNIDVVPVTPKRV